MCSPSEFGRSPTSGFRPLDRPAGQPRRGDLHDPLFRLRGLQGVQLPMGYTTRFDWRPEVEQVKIYVDNYLVDSAIDSLAAPPSLADAAAGGRGAEGAAAVTHQSTSRPWRAGSGGSPAGPW